MLSVQSFFDLSEFDHLPLFGSPDDPVWCGLDSLKSYMDNFQYPSLQHPLLPKDAMVPETVILHEGQILSGADHEIIFGDATRGELKVMHGGVHLEGAAVVMAGAFLLGRQISIGRGVLIETGAMVKSPAIIGNRSEVRQGGYLRGYCLTGNSCVVGHTTEVKHSIFLDHAKAGHFAYLGDSILGRNANLGAGTKFANLKFLAGNVSIRTGTGLIDSGRRKLGAIIGDEAQTGCNSVTNPGTLLGPRSILMPNTTAPSGYHPPKSIIR
jgi:bifunctional N-acetylglucosamine-1-phosphate-uridyltransferase/glucosamine-1-phosphate-acetyltransferase GlmU-like protein